MKKALCPYCNNERNVALVYEQETVTVRNDDILVDSHFLKCESCNNTFDDPEDDFDVLDAAYRCYRKKYNMLQPEEIKSWRVRLGLTQVELSRLLGFGDVTINRYEGGKLQEASHDKAMRLATKSFNMLSLVMETEGVISDPAKRNKIISILEKNIDLEYSFESIYAFKFGKDAPDEFSGFKKLDLNKIFSAIEFFCYEEPIYKTKLNKLLFYADFKAFKCTTLSITGLEYIKMNYGPAPDNYEYYIATLIQNKSIILDEVGFGEKLASCKKPDLRIFSDDEIKILIDVKQHFKNFNASKISNFSHNEPAYINTQLLEKISYNFAKDLNI